MPGSTTPLYHGHHVHHNHHDEDDHHDHDDHDDHNDHDDHDDHDAHDDHDVHDDHDERQRPLPRPLKEVQRRENRNFFKKNVTENDIIFFEKYIFCVKK